MAASTGLKKLGLDYLAFDLENEKELFLHILRVHSNSLRYLSLSGNQLSSKFLLEICETLSEKTNKIEFIDLKDMKAVKEINWLTVVKTLSLLVKASQQKLLIDLTLE